MSLFKRYYQRWNSFDCEDHHGLTFLFEVLDLLGDLVIGLQNTLSLHQFHISTADFLGLAILLLDCSDYTLTVNVLKAVDSVL